MDKNFKKGRKEITINFSQMFALVIDSETTVSEGGKGSGWMETSPRLSSEEGKIWFKCKVNDSWVRTKWAIFEGYACVQLSVSRGEWTANNSQGKRKRKEKTILDVINSKPETMTEEYCNTSHNTLCRLSHNACYNNYIFQRKEWNRQ